MSAKKKTTKGGSRKTAGTGTRTGGKKKAAKKKTAGKKRIGDKKTAAKKGAGRRKAEGKKKTAVSGGSASKAPGAKKASSVPTRASGRTEKGKRGAKSLRKKELDDLRRMLLALRDRLTGQIAALQGASLESPDWVNLEEDGTDAFERQLALKLASSEEDSLFEIDEALRRMDQGQYGVCEACEGSIEKPRLKALPFARLCIDCKSEQEKQERRGNGALRR